MDLPGFVWLDSCYPLTQGTRYDIISALPYRTFKTQAGLTTLNEESGQITVLSDVDPINVLKQHLPHSILENNEDLPFVGGLIGFFGYELGKLLEPAASVHHPKILNATFPQMMMGLYDWTIVVDHLKQKTVCVFGENDPLINIKREQILTLLRSPEKTSCPSFTLTSPWQSSFSKEAYAAAFHQIKAYIHAGDCYQVNLSQSFSAHYRGDPFGFYQQLRMKNPAPFSAFLRYPDFQIASCSPERFLSANKSVIETKPIKGTRPRFADPIKDKESANTLLASEKDKAENLMIVDLLRNDLSKICENHSVNVEALFKLESYTSVHHLVSTISAKLARDNHLCDLISACFPGGSITGAPKIRAMQIIDELEPHLRGIYCGSIAYLSYNHRMDSNIAIRTLMCSQNHVVCHAGGAIVADSELEQEYAECFHKISAIFSTLEAISIPFGQATG
ncbi:MAG: pabB [Gammaproteobacteria bacterium]|nr:pabB [Gammaproteobacteria bacterium]